MDGKPDLETLQIALGVLKEVIGPIVHAKGQEEESEIIVRLIQDRDDLPEIVLVLLGMIISLMDVVTLTTGNYQRPCDYYHYVVSVHEQELASYN